MPCLNILPWLHGCSSPDFSEDEAAGAATPARRTASDPFQMHASGGGGGNTMHDWHEAWEDAKEEEGGEESETEPDSVSEPLPVLHHGPPRRTVFSFARLARRRYSSASGAPGLPAGPEGPRSLPQPLTRAVDKAGSGPAMAVPAPDTIPGPHAGPADMQVLGGAETHAPIHHPALPSTQSIAGSFPAKVPSALHQRHLGRSVTSAVFSDKATEER